MLKEPTSKSLLGATELTVVMPIREGFVDARETISYSTRLRFLLMTLNEIRKKAREVVRLREYAGPIERLRTINFVRFAVFDNDSKLLLAVSFDRPWEPYIRKIAKEAGPILDAICCHCEGFTENHRSDLGYPKFAEWVRRHQVGSDFFYAAAPELTADDLRYLKALEARQRATGDLHAFDREAAGLAVGDPGVEADEQAARTLTARRAKGRRIVESGVRVLKAIYRLQKYFAGDPVEHEFLRKTAQAILRAMPPKEDLKKAFKDLYDANREALEWFYEKREYEPEPPQARALKDEDRKTIQGNILTGYKHVEEDRLLLIRLRGKAGGRSFLKWIRDKLTSEADYRKLEEQKGHTSLIATNLALTTNGLVTLGLPESDYLQFPRAFREGMADRAGALGDVGVNHPDNWVLPKHAETGDEVLLETVDAVLQLSFRDVSDDNISKEVAAITKRKDIEVLCVETMRRLENDEGQVKEHFGFADGIGQPRVVEDGKPVSHWNEVSLGELFHGYANDRGDSPNDAQPALLKNGTFMVLRKLDQHVDRLWDRLTEQGKTLGGVDPDWLASRMLGRTPEGEPVVPGAKDGPIAGEKNDFDYYLKTGKPDMGSLCPYQAHMRRAFPRRHARNATQAPPRDARIVRRGMPYEENGAKGLMFIAFNASIAEQFEIIQRWITGGNSTGVLSDQSDPLLGVPRPGEDRIFRFRHVWTDADGKQQDKVLRVNLGSEPFVTLRWGTYLFVPSLDAIDQLANGVDGNHEREIRKGSEIIGRLQLLERIDPERARRGWQKVLEDLAVRRAGVSRAVWRAIDHQHDGVLRTPYGVLVARPKAIHAVLRDPNTFSVREYWDRMRKTIGAGFLGMDPQPREIQGDPGPEARALDERYRREVSSGDYDRDAGVANPIVETVSMDDGHAGAREITEAMVGKLITDGELDLKALGVAVIGELTKRWFGFPRPDRSAPQPYQPIVDLTYVARYIFSSPHPTDYLVGEAMSRGKELLEKGVEFVKAARKHEALRGKLSGELFDKIPDDEKLAKTIIGLANGFSSPTLGSFLSAMAVLLESAQFWRLRQELRLHPEKKKRVVIERAVIAAMQRAPNPSLLHRTAVTDTEIDGAQVKSGDRVVLGLDYAAQFEPDGDYGMLFGGVSLGSGRAGSHACPGYRWGLGTISGMLEALLEAGPFRPGTSPLTLVTEPDK